VLGLTLPDWFTPDNIRTIALVVGIGCVVLILLVMRFVQKLMMKLSLTVLLALVGFGAWYYRADLGDCAKTCECQVLHVDIKIPKDQLPADQSIVCAGKADPTK
jgi:hypothetical protein